jgi:hypothetical protein
MSAILQMHTTVLPGHKIELTAPELAVGDVVEVTLKKADAPDAQRTVLDLIRSFPTGRLFKTGAQVDEYLEQERRSWGR